MNRSGYLFAVVGVTGCANLIGADFDSKREKTPSDSAEGDFRSAGGMGGGAGAGSAQGDGGDSDRLGSGGTKAGDLVINEVAWGEAQFIELYNRGGTTVRLSGHSLFKNNEQELWRFPMDPPSQPDTSLQPDEFMVIWRYRSPTPCEAACSVYTALLAEGDSVTLHSLTEVLDEVELSADVPEGGAWGRSPDGVGPFMSLDVASPEAPNYDP